VSLWHGVSAILMKDLRAEWRTKERLSPMVFFVLLTLLVFNFAFEIGGAALHEIGPGVLWSSYVFACVLGLNRSFVDERENGCLEALLVAPVGRTALYLAKMLGNLLFLLVVELLSLPFFCVFFNLQPGGFMIPLVGVFVLGAAALASVGTLFAAMSSNLRLRELLLPMLLLPMVMPVIIACVEATGAILQGAQLPEYLAYLKMLVVFTVVFVTLSLMLFDKVIEE
jgi:heme exporter protein B